MSQEPAEANRYLYEKIYAELKEEILSGVYKKGDWFPPERVLKDRFDTTHLTVRNALAKLVLEGYIERYSGKGTVVIYAREKASASRPKLRFPFVHVILEDIGAANARLLETLETRLRAVPLPVRVSCHHGDAILARGLLADAEESGALLVLQPAGMRATVRIGNGASSGIGPLVAVDEAEGARRAARWLRRQGREVVALVGASSLQGPVHDALVEEAVRSGLSAGAVIAHACPPGVEGGAAAAEELTARRPDCRGFLGASDETAAGLVKGLSARGLTPGRDCSVAGWGNTPLARAMLITSVDPGLDRLAQTVVSIVEEAMHRGELGDQAFSITPELQVRDT